MNRKQYTGKPHPSGGRIIKGEGYRDYRGGFLQSENHVKDSGEATAAKGKYRVDPGASARGSSTPEYDGGAPDVDYNVDF